MRYSFYLACLLFILTSCNNSANQESTTADSSALVKLKKPRKHSSDQQGLTLEQLNHICIAPHPQQEDHGHRMEQVITVYMEDDPVMVAINYICTNNQTMIPAAYNTTVKPAGFKYMMNYQAHIVIDIPRQHKIDIVVDRDSFKTAVRDEIWKYGTIADVPLFEGYDDGSKSFKFSFLLSLPTMDITYRQFAELSVTPEGKVSATKLDTIPEVQEE